MNKTVSIILIVLLSILAVALSVFMGFMIKFNKGWGSFNFGFVFGGYSTNLVESKTIDDIKDINVDTKTADVIVEYSNDNKIIVELYTDYDDEHYIKNEDESINILLKEEEYKFSLFRKSSKVLIKMPKEYDKKLSVKSTTGDIKLESFENLELTVENNTGDIDAGSMKSIDAKLTTGDVTVLDVKTANIDVTTGDVRVNTVDNIYIHTTTGDTRINTVNNQLTIKQGTGDVRIENATINENSSINTTTGDVTINTLTNAYINATAKTGDIKINNNDRTLENEITITTTTGDIKVNK